jgi:transcriptional regulator CtsR
MSSLADEIERYIKQLIEQSTQRTIRLSRSQLAEMFDCVPSQINYVLSTRFNTEKGYIVESRRGGGGYLRIIRLSISDFQDMMDLINSTPDQASQRAGEDLIQRLYEEDILTKREAMLMNAIIQEETLAVRLQDTDKIRGNIIKGMLATILRKDFMED